MQILSPIRLAVTAIILCAPLSSHAASGQTLTQTRTKPSPTAPSTLPAIQPTAPAPPPPPPTPAQQPPQQARVSWTDSTLSVAAENSSLNQILHEISRQTGIKISGSVADERVFGQYGPGPLDQVLTSLLDGTSGNMLILKGDATAPAQLILTPRNGAPTPPNPNAASVNDEPEYHNPPIAQPQPDPTPQPAPAATAPASTAATDPNAAPNNGQPQSPNGVKTPQQIYDELQKLRQQQQQPAQPQ